ncbi:RNA polymerase sigma factor [Candidatus Latescibacterota bacterium]
MAPVFAGQENAGSEDLMHDQTLVKRLKESAPDAIDEIVERYKRPLFSFIVRITNDHTAAEDIFQETWLRVIRYISKFRGDSKFSTWLFQIALNLCRDVERKKKRWLHVPIEDYEDSLVSKQGVDTTRIIKAQQVREIVATLPEKMREVVVLRYFHDMSDEEIAEIIGCPEGTVKSRFHRASKILRKKWELANKIESREMNNYETA